MFNWLFGRQSTPESGDLVPPKKLADFVGGGFDRMGKKFVRFFEEFGELQTSDHVLDVGCGCGRMAVPLTRILDESGTYDGFDIHPESIKWCQDNITPRFPAFQFHVADIFNKLYNKKGKLSASEFRFPFGDARFDFVFLTSVFTHMMRADMEHYVNEIARVTKPGGRCFLTYFILTDDAKQRIADGGSSLRFDHHFQDTLISDPKIPEAAVAFSIDEIQQSLQSHGLALTEPIRYGLWSGNPDGLTYQDIVVAKKAA